MHDEIDEVYATGTTCSDEIKHVGTGYGNALLKFKKGALGSINNSRRGLWF